MATAKTAVSRIEYRTNMMRAGADVIPLGFLVECCWDDYRWMGMIYRPSLTVNERRTINVATWPELKDPAIHLRSMFDAAWAAPDGKAGDELQHAYGCLSALHVQVCDRASTFANGLSSAVDAEIQTALLKRLQQFNDQLQPACAAQVLKMPKNPKAKTFAAAEPARHEGLRAAG